MKYANTLDLSQRALCSSMNCSYDVLSALFWESGVCVERQPTSMTYNCSYIPKAHGIFRVYTIVFVFNKWL